MLTCVTPVNANSISESISVQEFEDRAENRKFETYALVYDEKTGETIRIELESPEVNIQMNDKGEAVITNTYTIDKSGTCVEGAVNPRASQTNTNTFYGYEGTVSITYTDDGTYACLQTAKGSWKKVSGSYVMSDTSITYGQDLGTNSANGSKSYTGISIFVTTAYKPGKYGSNLGHKLGANLSGKINGSYYTVVCNVHF